MTTICVEAICDASNTDTVPYNALPALINEAHVNSCTEHEVKWIPHQYVNFLNTSIQAAVSTLIIVICCPLNIAHHMLFMVP
ncbi:hypothetical protein EMCRGX_G032462 [Ephydatia muelleri]